LEKYWPGKYNVLMYQPENLIIGAGPAGLGCAYLLSRRGQPVLVLDKNCSPGGLSRTIDFEGYLFDIGGHRFISKIEEISQLWQEVMGDDLLKVRRMSRILYRQKYFSYPLSFFNAFWNLGPAESFLSVASYFRHKYLSPPDEETVEKWIVRRFGRRLYNIFFRSYSEKVWGTSCQNISADWARQRIRGLSLRVALKNAVMGLKGAGQKTLSEEFFYPRKGPGQFFERLASMVSAQKDSQVLLEENVFSVRHDAQKIVSVSAENIRSREKRELRTARLFSTMPVPELVRVMRPEVPAVVLESAGRLKFRSYMTVNIILGRKEVFPDQWLYIHSPEVRLARVQNFKNWSADMVPDQSRTTLGLEYFCDEGDDLWNLSDVDLTELALEELEKTHIASRRDLIKSFVVRCPRAYPIYHMDYQKDLRVVRDYLAGFDNLLTFGRAGAFRYDNSDRAIFSGLAAAERAFGQRGRDLWDLETSDDYLE
jgi:protoporphyrinogen oxidase